MRILVSGSLALDRIHAFEGVFADQILPDRIHSLNVGFYSPTLTESFGGCAGNIAYNLALLGDQATVLSLVGKDFDAYRAWLVRHGVDTSALEVDPERITACATVLTDARNNQISAFYPGAMSLPYTFGPLAGDFAIVAPANPDDMRTLPRRCRESGIPYLYDPGQQIPTLSADDLRDGITGARGLISNDYELAHILSKTGWDEADVMAGAELLITTLGERGSRIRTKDAVVEVPPAKPDNTSDPTGAGDAYRAGFVHGLLRGWPLQTCGKLGGLVAAYTVEKAGTQTHTFTAAELAARYEQNYGEPLPAETT